jgi:phospholipase/carboxylesterase
MLELKFFEYSDTKQPKYLVIFLHGYGANGENLLDLAYEFKNVLPEAHFISPNAIEPWEGGFPGCYQWFSLSKGMERRSMIDMAADVIRSNQVLKSFVKKQLARFNLTEKNLFLMGFSQGGMMSMYQGLIKDEKPAGIISFSGKLVLPEMLGQKIIHKPNVCLIHGKEDSVLPFSNFIEAEKLLKQENIPFESHAFDGLDHSIDIRGIRAAQEFIKKQIKT